MGLFQGFVFGKCFAPWSLYTINDILEKGSRRAAEGFEAAERVIALLSLEVV